MKYYKFRWGLGIRPNPYNNKEIIKLINKQKNLKNINEIK